jgi:hypothetical protein
MSGKRNTLLLHCSLQRATGRMLVHTVEVNNIANDHVSVLPSWGCGQALSSGSEQSSQLQAFLFVTLHAWHLVRGYPA